jgi:hypothetical protein
MIKKLQKFSLSSAFLVSVFIATLSFKINNPSGLNNLSMEILGPNLAEGTACGVVITCANGTGSGSGSGSGSSSGTSTSTATGSSTSTATGSSTSTATATATATGTGTSTSTATGSGSGGIGMLKEGDPYTTVY